MTKNTALNRVLILLLVLLFLLLNFTFLTAFFLNSVTVSPGEAGAHDSGGASINLSFRSSLDYLDAESISPRFCSTRVVSLKKTTDERYRDVCPFLSRGSSKAHYRTFCLELTFGKTSPAIICEFMHSKDGML